MNNQVSFDDEMLVLVDEQGETIGSDTKIACHQSGGKLHRAFSSYIINSSDELLLQQRSASKPLWPKFWANSCCSHPRVGEHEEEAVKRRLSEELGIVADNLQKRFEFEYIANYLDLGTEHELCAVYTGRYSGPIMPNENELIDYKWASIFEMDDLMAVEPEIYSPWLKIAWKQLGPLLIKEASNE